MGYYIMSPDAWMLNAGAFIGAMIAAYNSVRAKIAARDNVQLTRLEMSLAQLTLKVDDTALHIKTVESRLDSHIDTNRRH
jgi:hypothetical protein